MSKSSVFLASILGTALFLPALCFAEIEGNYSSTYKGVDNVRITKSGDVYKVRWDVHDGSHWVGIGLVNEQTSTFAVASVISKGKDVEYVDGTLHISVYKIGNQGRLVSEAARYGDKAIHKEILIPK